VVFGLSASVAWALANVAIHKAARLAGDMVPALWGQIFGAVVLSLALPFWPPVRWPAQPGWLVVAGLASAFGYIGMFRAFARGPVSVLSPIIAGWALVSALFGVAVFGEALPPTRLVGGLLVIGGVMGIAAQQPAGEAGGAEAWLAPRWQVLATAATSAVGFGVMVAALGPVGHDLGPVAAILAVWAVQWVVLLPFAWRSTGGRLLPPRVALPTLVLLGLCESTGFLMVEIGALKAPLTVVAPTASVAALVTVALGKVWLGEEVGWLRALLATVVVAGIALLAVG